MTDPGRCDYCRRPLGRFWKKIIHEIGGVVLGRRYWRNRAQQLEQGLLREETIASLIREREQFRAEVNGLRNGIAQTDQQAKIQGERMEGLVKDNDSWQADQQRWFWEAKKAHDEAAWYKRMIYGRELE